MVCLPVIIISGLYNRLIVDCSPVKSQTWLMKLVVIAITGSFVPLYLILMRILFSGSVFDESQPPRVGGISSGPLVMIVEKGDINKGYLESLLSRMIKNIHRFLVAPRPPLNHSNRTKKFYSVGKICEIKKIGKHF